MLKLEKLIGWGATRQCYEHPKTRGKCIKVFLAPEKALQSFSRELEVYKQIKPLLGRFICDYDLELAKTDKGPGLVSELISDDNGEISQPLVSYVVRGEINPEISAEIRSFAKLLLEKQIFFYDFNLMNFVVQKKGQHFQLRYIDMKSFRSYKSWSYLKLENFSAYIARHIMKRRLKRLFSTLKLPFDF